MSANKAKECLERANMKIGNLYILWRNKIVEEELDEILKDFPDISKNNVNVLVRYNSDNYIVWLDHDNEFDWETTDIFEKNDNVDKYISKLGVLQHQPIARCLSRKQYREFNYMLAETVVLVLENEIKEADKRICEIETYLNNRNCEITRKWQLSYCFIIVFAILFLFIIFRHNRETVSSYFCISNNTINLLGYTVLGTIGATLSIIQKSGNRCYDCESGKFLNFLEILSRMFASVISSFVVVYLYKLDLIFANFRSSENTTYCLIILCIIAGFSERLVPSIISRFEDNEIKEENSNE